MAPTWCYMGRIRRCGLLGESVTGVELEVSKPPANPNMPFLPLTCRSRYGLLAAAPAIYHLKRVQYSGAKLYFVALARWRQEVQG